MLPNILSNSKCRIIFVYQSDRSLLIILESCFRVPLEVSFDAKTSKRAANSNRQKHIVSLHEMENHIIINFASVISFQSCRSVSHCGNFVIFQILREINFEDSRSSQFSSSAIWFFRIFCTFLRLKFTKLTKFGAPTIA